MQGRWVRLEHLCLARDQFAWVVWARLVQEDEVPPLSTILQNPGETVSGPWMHLNRFLLQMLQVDQAPFSHYLLLHCSSLDSFVVPPLLVWDCHQGNRQKSLHQLLEVQVGRLPLHCSQASHSSQPTLLLLLA